MPDAWQSFIRGRLSGISIPTAGLPAPVVSCLLGALLLAAGCSQVPTVPSLSLPAPVAGEKIPLASAVGELALYAADEASDSPQPALLLIHSVNAAGSAYEVRPLFDRYRAQRAVYALDLPGFGTSARDDRRYTARLMTDAVQLATQAIRARHEGARIDALALSLSSEFLARAASEQPGSYRSLALISPTGFNRGAPFLGPPEANRGMPWLHWLFSKPPWRQAFFRLLTSERSMRYFLAKTWGSPDIDEGLLRYDRLLAAQPGARFAPYSFVSGFLFSADITRIYESLQLPVWMAYGERGDFVDYRDQPRFAGRPNWHFSRFATGAMPHFEKPLAFAAAYDEFLASLAVETTNR